MQVKRYVPETETTIAAEIYQSFTISKDCSLVGDFNIRLSKSDIFICFITKSCKQKFCIVFYGSLCYKNDTVSQYCKGSNSYIYTKYNCNCSE